MEPSYYSSDTHSARSLASEISVLHEAFSDVLEYIGHVRFIAATAEATMERLRVRLERLEEIVTEAASIQAPTTPTGPSAPWKEDETDFEGENGQSHEKVDS